jgi:hypothetical protein
MADKDSIGGLNEAVETLNKDNHQDSIQSNQVLGDISATMQDVYSINSQMLEVMTAIQQSLAPDAFGAAQATETSREGAGAPVVGGPADASAVQSSGGGGGGFGMLALAGAAVAGGVAGIIAGLAGLLDFDADKVKEKVKTLLSIKDEVADGSLLKMLGESGTFALAMGGIGFGLAAFGLGAAVMGGGMALADWTGGENWSQKIKDHVVTLMSIKDALGGNLDFLASGGTFALAMTGVGAGIAAFGLGAAVMGAGMSLSDWMGGENWSQTIKDHVITLMSIDDALGGAGSFIGESATFLLAMGGIGAGLAAFGIGSAIGGLGEAVAKFTSGENWSENVVNHVKTLASVSDEVDIEKAKTFAETMTIMGKGLATFGASEFLGAITSAGAKLVNFLSGNESPIEQMMKIADNSYDLEVGAASLEKIQSALAGLGSLNFDGSDLGLKEFAEDLVESIPAIEKAIMGGKIDGGLFFGDDVEFKGLASPDIDFESAIARIAQLKQALGGGMGGGSETTPASTATAVPASTGSIAGGGDMQVVEADGLTLPYNSSEKMRRSKQLAKALGLGSASRATFEAGIPTNIDGVDVPTYLYTDAEIDHINASRDVRAAMNNTTPTFIPTRQSGENLQMAQSEANANDQGTGDGTVAVQNNIAPNTVNNASTTNLASRNEHHNEQKYKLMGFA